MAEAEVNKDLSTPYKKKPFTVQILLPSSPADDS